MKTKCYCIGCKRHPLHHRRNEAQWITGWYPGRILFLQNERWQGVEVDCLKPESIIFDEWFFDDAEDFDYPVTAYGDGCAITGFIHHGSVIMAFCGNEDHEN